MTRKKWTVATSILLSTTFGLAQASNDFSGFTAMEFVQQEEAPLEMSFTKEERMSYNLGVDVARQFQKQGLSLDATSFALGFQEGAGDEVRFSNEEIHADIQALQQQVREKELHSQKTAAKENLMEGEAFLAENRQRDEISVTTPGLQYEVVKTGGGSTPKLDDVVTVHYRGKLLDGTEFDSSYSRGEPAVFPVSGVIPGWTEALQMMPEGSQWKVYVPANLAYGEQQVGPHISPNSTLVFDIELIKVGG